MMLRDVKLGGQACTARLSNHTAWQLGLSSSIHCALLTITTSTLGGYSVADLELTSRLKAFLLGKVKHQCT